MIAAARGTLAGATALVVYTLAGYPLVAGVLARLRPRPVRADPDACPPVSLVIAAHDEEEVIAAKLADTERLDYPAERLEVIVAADGSTDATVERAREAAGRMRLRVLHEPGRRGKLAAVDRAVAQASGDVIVLSDANNRYVPATLRELTAPFADPEVGVVTGRKAIDDGSGRPLDRAEGLYWRYESRLKEWESATGSVVAAAGEVLAFRREAYRSPDPAAITEDFAAALMAAADGWRVVYAPGAVSLEPASATVADEATRRSRLVTGRLQATAWLLPRLVRRRPGLAWRMVSHKSLRPFVPWALVTALPSSAVLSPHSRFARLALAVQVTLYGAAAAGRRDAVRGRRRTWTFVPYWFVRMQLAALQGTRDFTARRDMRAWTRVARG